MPARSLEAAFAISIAFASQGCAHVTPPAPPAAPSGEQSIDRVWSQVAIPSAPELVPVSLSATNSALLILDMYPVNCTLEKRPSCPGTIKNIRALLDTARATRMTVIYGAGLVSLNGPTEPVAELAKGPGEATVRGAANKFIGSDLDERLKAAKIETVVITGTSADAAVLYTASEAAMRGYRVVVPVDAMSSASRFAELYTAWHLKNTTSSVSGKVAVSRTDLITIE